VTKGGGKKKGYKKGRILLYRCKKKELTITEEKVDSVGWGGVQSKRGGTSKKRKEKNKKGKKKGRG